ncbi:MAG: hypothetical protein DI529_13745 [Chryseobacterium sp.]|nr:MAG: hypothetical protein DI529_13745 [Chryseobacterium sp.]
MNKLFLIIILLSIIGCSHKDEIINQEKLTGNDFNLFYNTPAKQLAKAVENEKIEDISEILKKKIVDPNFQEPKFGSTLLSLAIVNDKYKSVQTLLKYGANPNEHDNYRGTTPMIVAARNDNPEYLVLLLKYNGDPNSRENGKVSKTSDNSRTTALNSAISLSRIKTLEKVEILVNAGAQLNFSETDEFETPSPLSDAFVHKKLDVAFFLLNKGADFKKPLYSMIDGHKVYILEGLRKMILDTKTDDFKIKKKIINFLKQKGLDYNKEPIPDYILKDIKRKYPNDWEEYATIY